MRAFLRPSAFLAVLTTVAAAQQPEQPPPQQPPIRTGINFVRVDVIVSDKQGEPVLDLKQEEFAVAEDGKAQKIESFAIVKIATESQLNTPTPTAIRTDSDEEREAARPDVRLFVILLDDYHVRRGNDMGVRKPLMDFIQNQLAPSDMVALMYPLTPVTDLRFSRNHATLAGAIEKFEGRKFNYEPRNLFEQQYSNYPAATVERVRNEVTMGALKAAAMKMGGLREGRKSIIFVSEGFTHTLPAQLNDPIASMPGVGNPSSRQPGADNVNESQQFFNSATLMTDLREVFDVANRQNTSIYAVDPRGLTTFEYDINEGVGFNVDRRGLESSMDSLRVLADNTDGRAIVNRNDLAAGMKQIIRDSSGYYLIGYTSSQAPTDGKFHEIKVRVTRRGVTVRARKGYWAYTADDVARASAPPKPDAPSAVTAALNAIAAPARGRPVRSWIGTAKAEDGRTKVTFAWEPVAAVPGERRAEGAEPARVVLTVTSPDGRPVFRGRVPEEIPPDAASVTGGSVSFDSAPGQLQMRMVVESARGQVLDSVTRELTLPDFTKVQVSFGTPRLFRARTARDMAALKANPAAVPAAERDFSRAERLLVRADAYTPGGVTPVITARLLNRTGGAISDIPVQAAPDGSVELQLALAPLAAGDYLIELNAKTEAGSAQELLAFKIGR